MLLPHGNEKRDAARSLGGYRYQIYHSAIAWLNLGAEEKLFLEVAEDFIKIGQTNLFASQVKETAKNVSIISDDILATIDSYAELSKKKPSLVITLDHLTTSGIAKERDSKNRIGSEPALLTWRIADDLDTAVKLKRVLLSLRLLPETISFIDSIEDAKFLSGFIKRIRFVFGLEDSEHLERLALNIVLSKIQTLGGTVEIAKSCLNSIISKLLDVASKPDRSERFVDLVSLQQILDASTQITIPKTDLLPRLLRPFP